MAIKIGRWDCPVCGHVGNLGPQTHCQNCGSPRSSDVQFYLPDDAKEVKLKEKILEAKSGVDWECEYCGAENKALSKVCYSCGNPHDLTEKQRIEKIINIRTEKDEVPRPQPLPTPEPTSTQSTRGAWLRLILFLVVVAVGLYYLVFNTKDVEVEVIGMRWEKKINLQHYTWVEESAWEMPPNAQFIRKELAVHHTDQVPNGTVTKRRTVEVQVGTKKVKVGVKDLGNGYFEDIYELRPVYAQREETYQETVYKDVPVFKPLYYFKIKRWKDEKPLQRAGEGNRPQVPQANFKDPENWKFGDTVGHYWLSFRTAKGDTATLVAGDDSFTAWQKIGIGQKITVERSTLGVYFLPPERSPKNEKQTKK